MTNTCSLAQGVSPVPQPLGSYLMEAGLITSAQVAVALNDQKIMDGMRFGEVLVARGWIKQQTLDFMIEKVIEPERKATKAAKPTPPRSSTLNLIPKEAERQPLRLLSDDEGVNWVG